MKALASDKHIIVYGSSKQGKTSLVDKHLPYEKNVLVSCTPEVRVDGHLQVHFKIREHSARNRRPKTPTATAAKASVSTKFKALIPFFGSGEAAVGGEISGGSGKKMAFEPVEINLALPQEITKLLEKVGLRNS